MNLFQLGDFTLNSGDKSPWKIECGSLGDDDIAALAALARQLAGAFMSVEGVPRGGVLLARALKPFAGISGPHLIVDDVLTTGGSLERCRDHYVARNTFGDGYRGPDVLGVVVFARGQCPSWVRAVFQMPECFWTKPRHR